MRIAFENITVELGGRRLLEQVSGEVAPGSITAVLGPSGAGKTTLLRVLAGLTPLERGTVRLGEVDVTAFAPERRRLGMVFQDLRLFDFLSARENVRFGPRVAGLPPDEQRRLVDEALGWVHARELADRPARVLSGGERQRIAIARALAMRPSGLLLDEPFGSLDAELRRGLREELRSLAQKLGLTVVLVTHDRDDAFALASNVILLREGKVEQDGPVAELYDSPKSEYAARLLGEAALLSIAERRSGQARVGGEWIEVRGSGERVVLRPEQLMISAEPPGWPATLCDARFAGAGWRLTLDVDGRQLIALHPTLPTSPTLFVRPARPPHTI